MGKLTDKTFFLAATMVTAVAIAVALYFVKSLYISKGSSSPTQIEMSEGVAEIVMQHLQYNGQMLDKNALLDKYDSKGNLLQSNIKLMDLAKGRKCIAIFSTNNCFECAMQEIRMLKNLDFNNDDLICIYDSPVHENLQLSELSNKYYYELKSGKISNAIGDKPELPILLYTEDEHIVASCIVSTNTRPFTRQFHEFLEQMITES